MLKLAGNVTATGTDDIGSRFFKSYDPVLRDEIHQLARTLGLAAVLGKEHTGLVSAFPIVRPHGNRVVVHLVNYDVDVEKDVVREKTNVRIQLPSKLVRTGRLQAQLHGADFPEPQDLAIEAGIDTITCEVPRLRAAASVVILSDYTNLEEYLHSLTRPEAHSDTE